MGNAPYENEILDQTFDAEVAMTTKYIAVKHGTNEGQVNIAGDGETAIGILQTTAATAGDQVRVRRIGNSLAKANGVFSRGDIVNSAAATGKLDTAGSGEYGWEAMQDAPAQDAEVTVFVCGIGHYKP